MNGGGAGEHTGVSGYMRSSLQSPPPQVITINDSALLVNQSG